MSTTDSKDTGTIVVPTITSDVAGPLGVMRLPRLWVETDTGGARKTSRRLR